MVYEPDLMIMRKVIEGLRSLSGLSGCHQNSPDSSVAYALLLVIEQRETPTSQKTILAMFL